MTQRPLRVCAHAGVMIHHFAPGAASRRAVLPRWKPDSTPAEASAPRVRADGPSLPLRVRAVSLYGGDARRMWARCAQGRSLGANPRAFLSGVALVHKEAARRFGAVPIRPHYRPIAVGHREPRMGRRVGPRVLSRPGIGLAGGGFVDLRGMTGNCLAQTRTSQAPTGETSPSECRIMRRP